MAFGLNSKNEMPAEIATWSLDYVTHKKGEEKKLESIPMALCGKDIPHWPKKEIEHS